MTLPPFYLVVDRAHWLPHFLPLGLKLVQLRAKALPEDELVREIAEAKRLCDRTGAILVVNDFWRQAIDARAPYVHLGQEDLAEADVPAIRRAGIRLGVSTHSDEELETALAADPDYVALGPIYPTTLKVMPWAPQGLERIGDWKRRIGGRPLVAIGGITLERAAGVYRAGADSIAVVSDVLSNPEPEARLSAWLETAAQATAVRTP